MCLYVLISCVAIVVFGLAYFFIQEFDLFRENFYALTIKSEEIVFETDEKFLSVALDTSFMRQKFHELNDRQWEMLEELSSLLSPCYFRLGGTEADLVVFTLDDVANVQNLSNSAYDSDDYLLNDFLYITAEDWVKVNDFALRSGLNLIFDLNVLLRAGQVWNSSNAESLIKFSEENGFRLDFQLGNEPNSFLHVFNVFVSGTQLAEDFKALRNILSATKEYRRSKLIGPDVTRPKKCQTDSLEYLRQFLMNDSSVDVVSWHQYYLNGREAKLEDFINPETFEKLPLQIDAIKEIVQESSKDLPIWLSETGSAYGGGAPLLSDRFAASFLWLDKLGMSAKKGISVVIRQSLFEGYYALISPNFLPNPDFWVSFLYKNLVGNKVVSVSGDSIENSKFLRFYCHCLKPNATVNGSLVVYGMNLSRKTELVVIKGIDFSEPVYSFTLNAHSDNLKSQSIFLNDMNLIYDRNTIYHWLKKGKPVNSPLVLPRYSIVFWVIQETKPSACFQT